MDNRSIQRALRDIDVNDIVNAFAGANDYALEWYSYDETPGDYELKDFSIKRDRE